MRRRATVRGAAVRAAAWAVLAAGAAAAAAQETTSWTLGGSVSARPFASYSGGPDPWAGALSFGSQTALDLDLRARGPASGGVGARAEASLEATVMTGAAARAAWSAAALGLASPDGLVLPYPARGSADAAGPYPEALLSARVRTLFVRLDLGAATATLGRQVLSYGRGAYWSPVDLFAELDATGLSPAKKGVDALRLRAGLGRTGLLDLAAEPRSDPALGSYALRASGMAAGIDGAVSVARIGESSSWAFAADFKADALAAFYGEALWLVPDGGEGRLRAAAGLDWSVGDAVAAVEYCFDGDPATGPAGIGSHNAYASLSLAAGDFLSLGIAATASAGAAAAPGADGEWRWTATAFAAWDLAQGAAATAYARALRAGAGAESLRADAGLALELEF